MRGYANERDLAPLVSEGVYPRRAPQRRPPPLSPIAFPRSAAVPEGFAVSRRADREPQRLSTAARHTLDGIGGLGWAVIGFLIGAIFWHFVGFWSFVSEVVLAGHAPDRITEASRPLASVAEEAPAAVPLQKGALALGASCTALALDRRTGRTSAAGCSEGANLELSVVTKPRQDRVAAGAGRGSDAPDARRRIIAPGKQ